MEYNENQTDMKEWEEEVKKLEEQGGYFKPPAGQYDIEVLAPPLKKEYKYEKEGIKEQIELQIKVDGKEYLWTITKGLTLASLYGQVLKVATQQGKWKGLKFTLGVKSAGQMPDGNLKRDYFIPQANVR